MSDQVFVLKSLIYLCTKNYKKVYAYFVDFKKAYDTIWRNSLFYKLMKYGFSQTIIFLLKSMYGRVVSAVKVKSRLTATFTPLIGEWQGCNLSPTLINVFINDIVDLFDSTCDPLIMGECKINCLLSADDYSLSCFPNQKMVCRDAYDRLNCYVKKWQLI